MIKKFVSENVKHWTRQAYIEENEQKGAMCRQRECELTRLLLWIKNTVPPQDKNAHVLQSSNYATYSYRATVAAGFVHIKGTIHIKGYWALNVVKRAF